jgi:voltage-gated potassium channel
MVEPEYRNSSGWRYRLFRIIFHHDTPAGKKFDVILLWLILLSVIIVIAESIPHYHDAYFNFFYSIEWVLTVLFTFEYIIRVITYPKPLKYIFSFWGIIDLLAILPTYLDFFFSGSHYLLTVRVFRLLRVFRILRLVHFSKEARMLVHSLRKSGYKIGVFLMSVLAIVTLLGTLMYVVEGAENGFTSIPESIYWAIVTVTTVGFGDIVPQTVLGKMLSSIAMIMGYAIIAVPTGIITVEMARQTVETQPCPNCAHEVSRDVNFCENCGAKREQSSLTQGDD